MAKKSIAHRKALLKEEENLETMISKSGWEDTLNDKMKMDLQASAKEHIEKRKKEARVNLRLDDADVERFRQLALREGIGYQTLMVSILHKYAQGNLVDKIVLDQLTKSLKKSA